MTCEAIQEDVLRALVQQHAVRDCMVTQVDGGNPIRLLGVTRIWCHALQYRQRVSSQWNALEFLAAGRGNTT